MGIRSTDPRAFIEGGGLRREKNYGGFRDTSRCDKNVSARE